MRAAVRTIERSIVHYSGPAAALADRMDRYGQAYAHAVYIQETTVREFNGTRKQATRLVGIEPDDGTFVADYPLVVLAAPWVSAEARAAGELFSRWLTPRITAKNAAESGFRARRPTGLTLLELPQPQVLAAIREAWHKDRKPANIVLVVDTSSSMGAAGRLDAVKQGLLSFVRELSPEDRVALVTSGAAIGTDVSLGPSSRSGPAVSRAVPICSRTETCRCTRPSRARSPTSARCTTPTGSTRSSCSRTEPGRPPVGQELLRRVAAEPVPVGRQRPDLHRRLRRRGGHGRTEGDRRRVGRCVLHRQPEGHQGCLREHLVLLSEAAVRLIGRYRVEREIGRGGMAVVHLAQQLDSNGTWR